MDDQATLRAADMDTTILACRPAYMRQILPDIWRGVFTPFKIYDTIVISMIVRLIYTIARPNKNL